MSPAGPGVSISIEAQNRATAAFRGLQNDLRQTQAGVNGLNASNASLATGAADSQRANEAFRRSLGVTGAELRNATLTSERLTESQRRFERQVVRGNVSLDQFHDQMRGGRRTLGDYARGIGNIHVQFIALGIANRAFQSVLNSTVIAQGRAAITLERLQVGLRAISTDTEAATEQYGRLIEVAKLPGINLENALRSSLQLQAIGQDGARAAEVIGEFGNALALSGQSSNELRRVVEGLRQISGEGKILQEDIAIITARVAALVPGLREAFGGTRAEDIRRTYTALGVAPSDQGARFIEDVLGILRELPRAGNTAANSIENLFDTLERAQSSIGRSFLPIIRESTAALEGFLQQIERDPQLARQIAQFEAFAGTLGTVALGIAGVGAIASIVGPGIIAAFTHPVGIAALALGGLAATIVTLKVAADETVGPNQRLRDIINDYNDTLSQHTDRQRAAATSQQTLTEAIDAHTRAREAQTVAQRAVNDAERAVANTSGDATDASRILAEARALLEIANTDLEASEKAVEAATKDTAEAQRQAALSGTEQFNALKEALDADRQAVIDLREELKALDDELLTLIGREDIDSLRRVGEIRARRQEIVGTPESQTGGIVRQLQDLGGFLAGLNVNNLFSDEQVTEQTVGPERTVGGLLPEAQTRISIGEVEVENIERQLGRTADVAEETGAQVAETLEDHITNLASLATEGADTIARTLQEIDAFPVGGGGRGPDPAAETARQVRDIAFDVGNELISIAEATELAQIEASAKRVASLARDNSLIIENEESLQSLIDATNQRLSERRDAFTARDLRDDRVQRDADALIEEYEEFDRIGQRFTELRQAQAEAVTADQKQELRDQLTAFVSTYQHATGAVQDFVTRAREQIATLTDQIHEIRFEQLEADVRVNIEEAFDEGEIRTAAQDLEGTLNESFENATGFFTRIFGQAAGNALRDVERLEERFRGARTVGQFQTVDRQNLEEIAELTQRIANLDVQIGQVGQAEAQATGLIALRDDLDAVLERAIRLNQQLSGAGFREFALAAEHATETVRVYRDEYGKLRDAFTGRGVSAASLVVGQFEEIDQATGEALQNIADIRKEFGQLQDRLANASGVSQFENVNRQARQLRESLQSLVAGLGDNGEAVARLDSDLSDLVETLGEFGQQAEDALDTARFQERIDAFRDGVQDVVADLASITITHIFDSLTSETDSAVESAQRRLEEFNEDRAIGLARLDEDQERRIRRLELARRRLLARRPVGDQRAFARFQDRLSENAQRLAEAREDAARRRSRFQEDTERRRGRLEESIGRADEGTGLASKITATLEQATISALSSAIAAGLGGLLKGPLDSIASFLGGGLASLFGDLFGGGGDDGHGDTQEPPMPMPETGDATGDADVTGTLSEVKTDENTKLPDISGLAGTLGEVKVTDSTTKPSVADLRGGIKEIILQTNAARPVVPNLKGGINDVVLQNNASLPSVDGLQAVVSSVKLADDIDFPAPPSYEALIGSVEFVEGIDFPALPGYQAVISGLTFAEGIAPPALSDYQATITGLAFAADIDIPALPQYDAVIGSIGFATGVDFPSIPNYQAVIGSVGFADGIDFPDLPQYGAVIGSVGFATGVDFPSIPHYQAVIGSIGFADGVDFPDIPGYEAIINNINFADGVDFPDIPGYEAIINNINFADGVDFPDIPGYEAFINSIKFADDIDFPNLPSQSLSIASIDFADGVDFPDIPGYEAFINSIKFADDIDFPNLPQFEGIVGSLEFAQGLDLPIIDLQGRVNVTGTQGGERSRTETEEDPENEMLDVDELTGTIDSLTISDAAKAALDPVNLEGEILASLVKRFTEPIILDGVINVTGLVYSGTIPAPGAASPPTTPPASLDRLNHQTDFSTDGNATGQGFGEQLANTNQVRGGGDQGTGIKGNFLTVTLAGSQLNALAQETTLADMGRAQATILESFQSLAASFDTVVAQNLTTNQHLSGIRRALLTEDVARIPLATETTLTSIADTLNRIQIATETTAQAPLVQQLVDAGVVFPNDPTDPTNAALTQSPITEILSQQGLSLFANFDLITQRIRELLPIAPNDQVPEPTDDAASMSDDDAPTATMPEVPSILDVNILNDSLPVTLSEGPSIADLIPIAGQLATESTLLSIDTTLGNLQTTLLADTPLLPEVPLVDGAGVLPTTVDGAGDVAGLSPNPDLAPSAPDFAEQIAQLQEGISVRIENERLPVDIVSSVPLHVAGGSIQTTPAPGSVQNVSVNEVLRAVIEGGHLSVDNTLAVEVLNSVAVTLGFGDISALSDRLFSDAVERQATNLNSLLDAG